MSAAVLGYNITLNQDSPLFTYQPYRDGDPTQGWNSSYTQTTKYDPANPWGTGVAYRRTFFEGSTVNIAFTGTAVYLCFTHTSASYTFAVDQQTISTAGDPSDPACAAYGAGSMVYVAGMAEGQHTATLELSVGDWTSTFEFFGGVVTVSAGVEGSTLSSNTPTYINNNDAGWTYLPSPSTSTVWHNSLNKTSGDYLDDRMVTCDYSEATTASYTFSGATAVYLLGGVQYNTFGYSISLDGTTMQYNSTNFFIVPQQVLFLASALDPTQNHTLTATNYAPDQSFPPSAACMNIDALVLVQSTPPPPAPPSSAAPSSPAQTGAPAAPAPVGAIAGGVVGGVAVLILFVLLACFLLRRRRQQRARLAPTPLGFYDVAQPYHLPGTAPLASPPLSTHTSSKFASPFPSPPIMPVLSEKAPARAAQQPQPAAIASVRRKAVPRTDSNGQMIRPAPPTPQSAASSSSNPASPPLAALADARPSRPVRPTPAAPAASGPAGPKRPNQGQGRARRTRERPNVQDLQHASTLDLVEVLSRRLGRGSVRLDGQEAPPEYQPV